MNEQKEILRGERDCLKTQLEINKSKCKFSLLTVIRLRLRVFVIGLLLSRNIIALAVALAIGAVIGVLK